MKQTWNAMLAGRLARFAKQDSRRALTIMHLLPERQVSVESTVKYSDKRREAAAAMRAMVWVPQRDRFARGVLLVVSRRARLVAQGRPRPPRRSSGHA